MIPPSRSPLPCPVHLPQYVVPSGSILFILNATLRFVNTHTQTHKCFTQVQTQSNIRPPFFFFSSFSSPLLTRTHKRTNTYFLPAAPKFVLTFFRLTSLSLSPPTSTLRPFLFSFLEAPPVFPVPLPPPPPPPAGVVAVVAGPNVLLTGVGAWLDDLGVLAAESDALLLLALYEMDDREKTRWCSRGATLRRCAADAAADDVVPPLISGSNPMSTLPLGVLSRYSLSLV